MSTLDKIKAVASAIVVIGILCLIAALGQIALWAMDRKPPFAILEYSAASAKPGGAATIYAKVHRDMNRRCSASYSQIFFDSTNARWELSDGAQLVNAQAIAELEKRMPGAMRIKVVIPAAAAPGMGILMTVKDYSCNPVHLFYPIAVVLMMDVNVLQP